MDAKYNVYLNDGDSRKTIAITDPDTTAEDNDFDSATDALAEAYGMPAISVGLASETVVWTAANGQ